MKILWFFFFFSLHIVLSSPIDIFLNFFCFLAPYNNTEKGKIRTTARIDRIIIRPYQSDDYRGCAVGTFLLASCEPRGRQGGRSFNNSLVDLSWERPIKQVVVVLDGAKDTGIQKGRYHNERKNWCLVSFHCFSFSFFFIGRHDMQGIELYNQVEEKGCGNF